MSQFSAPEEPHRLTASTASATILSMTTRRKKSWTEKLADDKDLPRTFQLEGKAAGKWGTGRMLIPAPQEVDAQMKRVRKGKVVTSTEIRAALQHHSAEAVDVVCPITTGIFCWIAANAAAEQQAQGRKNFTPYWRTLKVNGELNPKYSRRAGRHPRPT
ncbi:MAG: hypothetical protein R3F19_34945 [Verrucomicrobiales bacterium]